MYMRRTQPALPRPFRLWLYPLPPVFAIAGFAYILISRPNFERELLLAGVLIALGSVVLLLRGGPVVQEPDEIPVDSIG
jgi:hypothetical protein